MRYRMLLLIAMQACIATGEDTFWATDLVEKKVDLKREQHAAPEWQEPEAVLGAPDGRSARLVVHNGWNDSGAMILDFGREVSWGEVVLVHGQKGPGHARKTIVETAGEDQVFTRLSELRLAPPLVEAVLPFNQPVRYLRIAAGAGGAVPIDSTWYFDAVGIRTGLAAITRVTALQERIAVISASVEALEADAALKSAFQEEAGKASALIDERAALAPESMPAALAQAEQAIDQLATHAVRLAAAGKGGMLPDWTFSWASSMAKFRPEDPFTPADLNPAGKIRLARNETEALQLALIGGDAFFEGVSIEAGPFLHEDGKSLLPEEAFSFGMLGEVLVNNALWPDPIHTMQPFSLEAGEIKMIWVRVKAPADLRAGTWKGSLRITASGRDSLEAPLEITISNFTLPVRGHTANMISCGGGGVDDLLFRNRLSSGGGPCTGSIAEPRYLIHEDGRIELDFSEYDVLMQQAFDAGLARFALPLSAGDGGGFKPERLSRTFIRDDGRQEEVSMNPLAGAEEAARLATWLRLFTDHLREKGWFEVACFYLWDEPNPAYTETFLEIGRAIKAAVPDLKIVSVEAPYGPWHEVVDIYCPQVNWFGQKRIFERIEALHALGKELWWYNCGDPAPFPSWAIPHPAASARMVCLLLWKYKLNGNLYWAAGVNADLRSNHGQNPGADGRGDGQLYYIDEAGERIPSLRLEMIRDGIEDYEYLFILRERIANAKKAGKDTASFEPLLELPETIAFAKNQFTDEPVLINAWRTEIAAAIEAVGGL